MIGAYSNIKNRFFPGSGGGEKESPFLEELRDESVVRAMEDWNTTDTNDDDSALDKSGARPKGNSFEPPHEPRSNERPFGYHSHSYPQHHDRQGILFFTYILKIGMLIMSIVTIICVMASTENMEKECGRPKSAEFVMVVLFFSIVVNLCVLTICERFNLCCTIGRMEFFFHFFATIFLTIGVFLYGTWLFHAYLPLLSDQQRSTTSAIQTDVTSTTSASQPFWTSSAPINTSKIDAMVPIEANSAQGESFILQNEMAKNSASSKNNSINPYATATSSNPPRKRRQLINVTPEKPKLDVDKRVDQDDDINLNTPCAAFQIEWREYKYAIAALLIIFCILASHCGVILLYFFPCMGLMRRDNEARAINNVSCSMQHEHHPQQQRGSHQTAAYGMEMRSTNNNNATVDDERHAKRISPERHAEIDFNQMSNKPLMIKEKFMTSSPNVTPTKNQSLYKKVVNSNLWGPTKRNEDQQREGILHESVISADQLLETSVEDSDGNVDAVGASELNTTGEGDDVLFDAHDSALLRVVVRGASNEKP